MRTCSQPSHTVKMRTKYEVCPRVDRFLYLQIMNFCRVPIINYIDNDPAVCKGYPKWADGNTRSEYDHIVAEGKDLWWYQVCSQNTTHTHLTHVD